MLDGEPHIRQCGIQEARTSLREGDGQQPETLGGPRGKQTTTGGERMLARPGGAHLAPPLRGSLIAIVPPRLPAPGLLVSFTGVLELFGAAGLLVPATRMAAAVCLLLLLLAMFPANIYAARMPNPPKSM